MSGDWYKCRACDEEFPVEEARREVHADEGYTDTLCPYCGSDYISTADECALCGAIRFPEEMAVEGDDCCIECLEDMRKRAVKAISEVLDKDELEAFLWYFNLKAEVQ